MGSPAAIGALDQLQLGTADALRLGGKVGDQQKPGGAEEDADYAWKTITFICSKK
jgi:hypothetical protein